MQHHEEIAFRVDFRGRVVRTPDHSSIVLRFPARSSPSHGIFLQFSGQAIANWVLSPEVDARSNKLAAGFAEWKKEHAGSNREFPGAAYLMLHSFSHLL